MRPHFSTAVPTLDYDFSFDHHDRPVAEFSMGHEAFGLWFSEELGTNARKITALLDAVNRLENRTAFDATFNSMGLQLTLTREDAQICPMFDSFDELPEDTELSEDDTNAECGLADFKAALLDWQTFVGLNDYAA